MFFMINKHCKTLTDPKNANDNHLQTVGTVEKTLKTSMRALHVIIKQLQKESFSKASQIIW